MGVNDELVLEAKEDELKRFWDKVEKGSEDDCWNWTAGGDRYGVFWYRYAQYNAHRFSWIIRNGLIPDGMVIDHTCVNSKCVNPKHLQIVSHIENSKLSDRGRRKQSHCLRGHKLEGDNLYFHPTTGRRQCLACRKIRTDKSNATQAELRKFRPPKVIDREKRAWDNFWAKVDKQEHCWIWQGVAKEGTSGKFGFLGKTIYPHRLLFEQRFGKLGKSRIKNTCGDKLCVNPDHWERIDGRV